MLPFSISSDSITIMLKNSDGKIVPKTIRKDNDEQAFYNIRLALKEGRFDDVMNLVTPDDKIENNTGGRIKVIEKGSVPIIEIDNEQMHNSLTKRIIAMLSQGLSVAPMVAFYENILKNPNKDSINELYDFLERNDLPITEDGHFLAYKAVRSDYYDKHSGKILNAIGTTVEISRDKVDSDRRQECSYGLHIASMSYIKSSFYATGDRILVVKVNPKDVIAVPLDANAQKVRVCSYYVLKEHTDGPTDTFKSAVHKSDGEEISSVDLSNVKAASRFDKEVIKKFYNIRDSSGKFTKKIEPIAIQEPEVSFYNVRDKFGRFSRIG